MANDSHDKETVRPAGYAALIERYGLKVIPNWHKSMVAMNGVHQTLTVKGVVEEVYPAAYWPGETLGEHLEFALKYDGTNLAILACLFQKSVPEELSNYILSKPTGKYVRRLWYFYEFLTGKVLPIDDVKRGNYIDLLDSECYYTLTSPRQVRRQRINDNLLGDNRFCPMVRRTELLNGYEKADLSTYCQQVISGHSPGVLKRALSFFYTKETKSSFEIERIKPKSDRIERFVALLRLAEVEDFTEKAKLIDLQNQIVDKRFAQQDYRTIQNYVGETIDLERERIHYVCPKPDDLPVLMEGLFASHQRMESGHVSPVIHAAAIAYGFVFMHPFEDGNGRIHRFFIHNILARSGFTPKGFVFPVSATMLKNPEEYDASLEVFSQPLNAIVQYSLDREGFMTVHNDTSLFYRFIDLTAQAEVLFRFIEHTIKTELVEELTFLVNYDEAKSALQEIVAMPDRKIDLFIRFCLQNKGRLSVRKRESHFDFLSDDELTRMERAIQTVYGASETKVN